MNPPTKDMQIINGLIANNPKSFVASFHGGAVINSETIYSNTVFFSTDSDVRVFTKYDNKLLFKLPSRIPIGLLQLASSSDNYIYQCDADTTLVMLNIAELSEAIEENNLWNNVLRIIGYIVDLKEMHDCKVYQGISSYDAIKFCLQQIWDLPQEERSERSIFEYVSKRYKISRSSIAKILKSLNDGGYIKTRRGILLELNKLPSKY